MSLGDLLTELNAREKEKKLWESVENSAASEQQHEWGGGGSAWQAVQIFI